MKIRGFGSGLVTAMLMTAALVGCNAANDSAVPANCKPQHEFPTLQEGKLVVSSYTYAPSTIVRNDALGGIEGDLLRRVAKLECLELKVVEQAAAGVIPAVESGRADLAAGDWYRTKDRAKILGLSDPIYQDAMVFVSKGGRVSEVDDLLGKEVGTFEGNLWNADVKKLMNGNVKIFPSEAALFQDLATGRLDVAIDGSAGATNMIKVTGNSSLKMKVPSPDSRVGATTSPGQAGWPHAKDNEKLTAALNEDIGQLREDGVIARVLKKYGLPASAAEVGKPRLL